MTPPLQRCSSDKAAFGPVTRAHDGARKRSAVSNGAFAFSLLKTHHHRGGTRMNRHFGFAVALLAGIALAALSVKELQTGDRVAMHWGDCHDQRGSERIPRGSPSLLVSGDQSSMVAG